MTKHGDVLAVCSLDIFIINKKVSRIRLTKGVRGMYNV